VVLLIPVLVVRGTPPPDDPRLLLGALAGLSVTVELSLIYRALGRGEAFITAPIGALGAAAAVAFGLIGGDPIGVALTGIAIVAVVGVWPRSGAAGPSRHANPARRHRAGARGHGAARRGDAVNYLNRVHTSPRTI
jgi:hypothetical protein